MTLHPTNDNRRDPFDVLCDMVAGEMADTRADAKPMTRPSDHGATEVGRTAGLIPATGAATDLRRHHHEMLARLAAAQPPRIGRSESLDADGLQTLAEHMQETANAFAIYAKRGIKEFSHHSSIDREEVEAFMNAAFGDFLGALFNAVEDVREWTE